MTAQLDLALCTVYNTYTVQWTRGYAKVPEYTRFFFDLRKF